MNIKYTIKNIMRNKISSLLTIILILLALVSTYLLIMVSSNLKKEYEYIENYYNGGNVLRITTNWDYYKYKIDSIDKFIYEKIYNSLNEIEDIDLLHYERVAVNIDSKYIDMDNLEGKYKSGDGENIYLEGMGITNETLKHYDIELLEGSMFNEVDENDEVINIVAGYDLSKDFNINDIITSIDGTKYRITGFLKQGQYLPINIGMNLNLVYKKYNLDDSFICDFREFIGDGFSYYLPLSASYIHINNTVNNEEKEVLKRLIKDIFNENDIVVNVRDESKGINLTLGELEKQKELFNISSITILVFIFFSIVISIINSIEKRKVEFGVYILSGATIGDIAKITIYEMIIFDLIALMVFILGFNKLIDIQHLIGVLGIISIYMVLIFIIPLIKIKNISIKELIKGNE